MLGERGILTKEQESNEKVIAYYCVPAWTEHVFVLKILNLI